MSPYKEWLIQMLENLESAIDEGDYMLCNEIITDVKGYGFEYEAEDMVKLVESTPIKKFANIPTIYV